MIKSSIVWSDGEILPGISDAVLASKPNIEKRIYRDNLVSELSLRGYSVKTNTWVSDRGDGSRGLIDILADSKGHITAICIVGSNPTVKAHIKLNNSDADTVLMVGRCHRG